MPIETYMALRALRGSMKAFFTAKIKRIEIETTASQFNDRVRLRFRQPLIKKISYSKKEQKIQRMEG